MAANAIIEVQQTEKKLKVEIYFRAYTGRGTRGFVSAIFKDEKGDFVRSYSDLSLRMSQENKLILSEPQRNVNGDWQPIFLMDKALKELILNEIKPIYAKQARAELDAIEGDSVKTSTDMSAKDPMGTPQE